MKHWSMLLPIAVTASMLIAEEPQQRPPQRPQPPAQEQTQQDEQQQTVTGKIATSNDGKYVLVDPNGTMYQLDDQRTAKTFAGKMVKVSGTVDTASNSIHVTEIKAAS